MFTFLSKRAFWSAAVLVLFISFAGLVELLPLIIQQNSIKPLETLKRLSAIELAGEAIYIREGCNTCHTQMIRTLRHEVERYGHYSIAEETVYQHPHLWGSKRTGPDLARIGGKYSDDWHRMHLYDPRSLVPDSIMPAYPWLFYKKVNSKNITKRLKVLKILGVPYTDLEIEKAKDEIRNITEIEALVAYLQQLGKAIPKY